MSRSDGFLVEPLDTVWVRDGKPFTAGEASWAPGVFPPSPWTFQGLVRSRLLDGWFGADLGRIPRAEIEAAVGPPDRLPPGWRISGPLPARRVLMDRLSPLEPWVPWPAFLAAIRGGDPRRSRRVEVPALVARSDGEDVLVGGQAPGSGWLSARNLIWALLGHGTWDAAGSSPAPKRAQADVVLPGFVREERRPGLVIEDGRAADHMLYFGVHHRFEPRTGLWGALEAEAEAVDIMKSGGATLGKKDRAASLSAVETVLGWTDLLRGVHLARLSRSRFDLRVVLLTPALVERDREWPFSLPRGATVRAVEAASGPDIGGFDRFGTKRGRPVQATVAAGSSYWVHIEADSPDAASRAAREVLGLEAGSLTERERMGFGLRVGAPFEPSTGQPLSTEHANG